MPTMQPETRAVAGDVAPESCNLVGVVRPEPFRTDDRPRPGILAGIPLTELGELEEFPPLRL